MSLGAQTSFKMRGKRGTLPLGRCPRVTALRGCADRPKPFRSHRESPEFGSYSTHRGAYRAPSRGPRDPHPEGPGRSDLCCPLAVQTRAVTVSARVTELQPEGRVLTFHTRPLSPSRQGPRRGAGSGAVLQVFTPSRA